MSNKQLRNILRAVHLILGVAILVFIYSPLRLDSTFALLMQFLVLPLIILSGVVMWQQGRVVKLFKRGQTT